MIINADAKQLEINVAAFLSQDSILLDEVRNKVDLHKSNQIRFKLPGWQDAEQGIASPKADFGRLIAKKFSFRLIYGGSAYAYSVDPEFAEVGFNEKKWQAVIDEYYNKYKGMYNWHTKIIQEAVSTGRLVMPTGRTFVYEPKETWKGLQWPETTIKNYPVQGTGADVMSIIRVDFARMFWQAVKTNKIVGCLVSSVHDSLVVDVDEKSVDIVKDMLYNAFKRMPENFKKLFGVEYNLPLYSEISIGPNMKELNVV